MGPSTLGACGRCRACRSSVRERAPFYVLDASLSWHPWIDWRCAEMLSSPPESDTLPFPLRLRYDARLKRTVDRRLPEPFAGQLLPGVKQDVTVSATRDRIMIDVRGRAGSTAILDLDRESLLFLDHAQKRFARLDWKPDLETPEDEHRPRIRFGDPGERRTVQVGAVSALVERLELLWPEVELELWALAQPRGPASLTLPLWRVLVPWAAPSPTPPGIPVILIVRERRNPESLLDVRLEEWSKAADLLFPDPPASYTELRAGRQHRRVSDARPVRQHASPRPATDRRRLGIEARRLRVRTMRRGHDLRRGGQDFAWLMNQPALDQVREVVNAVARAFGRFAGDGAGGREPMHVIVDWWRQLSPRLSFRSVDEDGEEDITSDVLQAMRNL